VELSGENCIPHIPTMSDDSKNNNARRFSYSNAARPRLKLKPKLILRLGLRRGLKQKTQRCYTEKNVKLKIGIKFGKL